MVRGRLELGTSGLQGQHSYNSASPPFLTNWKKNAIVLHFQYMLMPKHAEHCEITG